MLAPLLFVMHLQAPVLPPPVAASAPATRTDPISGEGRPTVTIPRIEASVEIDGQLDEPAWSSAARLGKFWQWQPADGQPAVEQTEVLVWYSPTAIHFGILAHDSQPQSIRATVADRDNLDRDDTVTLYLDTFNDRRRAFFFTVNPLGAQQDGVQTEGGGSAGHAMGFEAGDRNPDYQFDSKGRLTGEGYAVEVRIPFKSLRYPGNGAQKWGFNVVRRVQRTGYEDTWTDVRRASSSFLVQVGTIDGLHDLKRGMVTEVQPFVAAAVNGARAPSSGAFTRGKPDYTPGVNVRLGFTNVSIDGTVNPDFSQVESDAGQVTVNERFALYYAEKRPFFLEGNELFSTPNQLVYTRTIVKPIAGGKVTGKVGQTSFAYLFARDQAADGDATFNIARFRRDLGTSSILGLTLTDRTTATGFNRVAAADARITFSKIFYVQAQLGGSTTEQGGRRRSSPAWNAVFDCTGRAWGCHYELLGVGTDFETRAGYVNRNDFVQLRAMNRATWYGRRGGPIESVSLNPSFNRLWTYAGFGEESAIEGSQGARASMQLRGGWEVNANLSGDFIRFDPADYSRYTVDAGGSSRAYLPLTRYSGATQSVTVTTPVFQRANASLQVSRGGVAIFPEGSEGAQRKVSATVGLRPTASIRAEGTVTVTRIRRQRDDSEFARTIIPRLKLEYQPRRSFFVRVVGEYRNERRAALLDALTGSPLLASGVPIAPTRAAGLRLDLLFSYEPTPGTVVFFGYGNSLDDRFLETSRVARFERASDGFFMKLAYQFRR